MEAHGTRGCSLRPDDPKKVDSRCINTVPKPHHQLFTTKHFTPTNPQDRSSTPPHPSTMYFPTTTISLALLSAVATAAPALEARQGGFFVSVGNKFSGKGCTPQTLIFADPIFGTGNSCQPLDRSGTSVPILSYQTTQTTADCKGKLFFFCGGRGGGCDNGRAYRLTS
jgi:hypothetical protein